LPILDLRKTTVKGAVIPEFYCWPLKCKNLSFCWLCIFGNIDTDKKRLEHRLVAQPIPKTIYWFDKDVHEKIPVFLAD
jgi:hypothetical protein